MSNLDKTIFQAKSRVVADYIRDDIRKSNLLPGERLNGVRKLAEKYSVGRQVVLSAFQVLAKDDILVTEARKGTYVNPVLETGHYYRLGVFINLTNFVKSMRFIDTLQQKASRKGYQLIVGSNFEEDFTVDEWIGRKRLDGVIVTGVVDDETVKQLKTTFVPFVIAGNYDIAGDIPQTTIDLPAIINKHLTAVLKSSGIKTLATVAGTLEFRADRECLDGVRKAISNSNLKLREEFIQTSGGDGFLEVARIMEDFSDKPDAFYIHGAHLNGFIKYFSTKNAQSRPILIVNNRIDRKELADITISYPNFGRMLGCAAFEKIMHEIR